MTSTIDQHVARRLRGKRRALGLSEDTVARQLGIETAQVLAYEKAMERVPTHHLVRLSEYLGVPISYFFPTDCPGE